MRLHNDSYKQIRSPVSPVSPDSCGVDEAESALVQVMLAEPVTRKRRGRPCKKTPADLSQLATLNTDTDIACVYLGGPRNPAEHTAWTDKHEDALSLSVGGWNRMRSDAQFGVLSPIVSSLSSALVLAATGGL